MAPLIDASKATGWCSTGVELTAAVFSAREIVDDCTSLVDASSFTTSSPLRFVSRPDVVEELAELDSAPAGDTTTALAFSLDEPVRGVRFGALSRVGPTAWDGWRLPFDDPRTPPVTSERSSFDLDDFPSFERGDDPVAVDEVGGLLAWSASAEADGESSARAMAGMAAMAPPTPSATASAPTRPMIFA